MAGSAQGRIQHARVSGLTIQVRYPVGRADIEYREVDANGELLPETHKLNLVVLAEDARQLAEQFAKLALAIEAAGGSKQ